MLVQLFLCARKVWECEVIGGIVGVNIEAAQLIHSVVVVWLAIELIHRHKPSAVHGDVMLANQHGEVLVRARVGKVAIKTCAHDGALPVVHPIQGIFTLGVLNDLQRVGFGVVQVVQFDNVLCTANASFWCYAFATVNVEVNALLQVALPLKALGL